MASATLEYVKRVAERLSFEDQLHLLEHLAKQLREVGGTSGAAVPGETGQPESLRGIWRDHFPTDADIDAALHEIRHEWEKELQEFFEE
jgi:hypothetical protein